MNTEERNKIVLDNLGLVWTAYKRIARKYPSSHRVGEAEDFVQEGIKTLMKAAEKFDPSRGFKFSTYAYVSVWKAMNRMLNTRGLICTPNPQKTGPLRRAWTDARRWRSLSEKDCHHSGGSAIDQIPDPNGEVFLQKIEESEEPTTAVMSDRMTARIQNPRQREAIYLYFFEDRTLREVGELMGFSKERARQMVQAGLDAASKTLKREEE